MSGICSWPIGFCSWCVGDDLNLLDNMKNDMGIDSLHLSLLPVIDKGQSDYTKLIQEKGFTVTATMVGFPQEDYRTLDSIRATGGIAPDECWNVNRERVLKAVKITAEMGVKYLSFHAGYIDPGPSVYAEKLYSRMKLLADVAAEYQVQILMETGQETAEQLSAFIAKLNHPSVGVNFDPGNMILYGKGDPVDSLHMLAPWIKHIHVKDAIASDKAGQWGTEMPWGKGQVGSQRFMRALIQVGFEGALAIEREVGGSKYDDTKCAVKELKNFLC